jgi:DNA polymerase-3 subunit epsilon
VREVFRFLGALLPGPPPGGGGGGARPLPPPPGPGGPGPGAPGAGAGQGPPPPLCGLPLRPGAGGAPPPPSSWATWRPPGPWAQEAEILLANPSHRLPLKGPLELQALGAAWCSAWPRRKPLWRRRVEARVQEAQGPRGAGKGHPLRLIAHLPQGVVLAPPGPRWSSTTPRPRSSWGRAWESQKPLWPAGPGLLAHALRLPKERFLTQARGKNLLLQAVPLSEGMGLLLEAQKGEEGLDEATLHRLKDKLAGLKALAEILAQEAPPEVRPLAEKAQEAAPGARPAGPGPKAPAPKPPRSWPKTSWPSWRRPWSGRPGSSRAWPWRRRPGGFSSGWTPTPWAGAWPPP